MLQLIGPMNFDTSKVDYNLETIIVDGGLNHFKSVNPLELAAKFKLALKSLGDNDSNDSHHKIEQKLSQKKDYNDFSFALSQSSDTEISALGFLGGRRDHEFANLLEAQNWVSRDKNRTINFENKIIVFSGEFLKIKHDGSFSLFSMSDCTVTLQGDITYKIFQEKLKAHSSHGLSNEASGLIEIINREKVSLILYLN